MFPVQFIQRFYDMIIIDFLNFLLEHGNGIWPRMGYVMCLLSCETDLSTEKYAMSKVSIGNVCRQTHLPKDRHPVKTTGQRPMSKK